MRTISPEALMPQGVGRWTPDNVAEAWAQASRALRSELADPETRVVLVMVGCPGSGKSTWLGAQPDRADVVAFDAVWAEPKRRASIVKRIADAGKLPIAVVVTSPRALCHERNNARPPWRRVPESFVDRAWSQIVAWPVSPAEGWARVVRVDGTAPAVPLVLG
jgi:predicted kinase